MVKVVWITPFAPDHSGGGGQIRQAHLLVALSACAEIELICPGPVSDPDVRAAVTRLVEVTPPLSHWREKHRWLRRVADIGASLAGHQPMEARRFRPVRRALRRALGDGEPDVVIVEYAGLAPLLPGWARARRRDRRGQPGGRLGQLSDRRGRWVLTLHNLPSRMAAHQAAVMPHRRQRWLLLRDANAAARFEQRAAASFDAVIACTAEDAGTLRRAAAEVIVVPNGVDPERFRPTPLSTGQRIVFTGALYTTPNVDGALWFCHEVLPLVRQQEPSVEVDLVGARPVEEVLALGRLAGVSVYPDVETVAPYLNAARVAVVPIRVGSGSRLKALEALAAGRPVVGTSIGLEGLRLRAGEHAWVADDTASFAAAVVRLLRDDELASALATAGHAYVVRRFSWAAITSAFTDAVLALSDRPGGPRRTAGSRPIRRPFRQG